MNKFAALACKHFGIIAIAAISVTIVLGFAYNVSHQPAREPDTVDAAGKCLAEAEALGKSFEETMRYCKEELSELEP